jgi:hypothetical protein
MGGLRRWMRNLERNARETSGWMVLIDERDGSTYQVPKDAFLQLLGSLEPDVMNTPEEERPEPEPWMLEVAPRLQHLYDTNGNPFWLEDMRWSGKTAANAREGETTTLDRRRVPTSRCLYLWE